MKDFAKITVPLTNLTRKALEFTWDDKAEEAFTTLKKKLLSAPILSVYDPNLPCEVWCNASSFAVGAVLL